MASEVSASRNDSNWGQSRPGFMKSLNSNPNPNSAPQKLQIYPKNGLDETAGVVSEQKSFNNNNGIGFNRGAYVTLNLPSHPSMEFFELKIRLVDELDRIRSLAARIENGEFEQNCNNKVLGSKRPKGPSFPPSDRETKRFASVSGSPAVMNMCSQVLGKLMKHKHGWIFNIPVDVVGMGLHDYYQLVKTPMDLGTVKSKLAKNLYLNPDEFASDVRLTFNNAMLYNPKGHDVYIMAEQFIVRFEDFFRPVYRKFLEDQPDRMVHDAIDKVKNVNSQPVEKPSTSASNLPELKSPVLPRSSPTKPIPSKTIHSVKQPKPRAKDPNKRVMSLDEKQKLGVGLQNLPPEKMGQVVHIIKKRNEHLTDECDEIELDIGALDTETLWELDRLVTNWKKMVSKIKRQSLLDNPVLADSDDKGNVNKRPNGTSDVKRPKKSEHGDEDVDIGDNEIPASSFAPVEIEKDVGPATSSSSSSTSSTSDSSSSSDSESGSSSGSDSDADDMQSRGPEAKDLCKT